MKNSQHDRAFRLLLIFSAAFLLSPIFSTTAFADPEVTCECLDTHCGKCETETGVDFYTEKCGPGLSKVKSCKRPQCAPVLEQEFCLAKLMGAPAPQRSIASARTPETTLESPIEVILAVGRSRLERGDSSFDLVKGMKVSVGDRVVTAEDGRVRIRFPELSEIFVSPQSSIVISEALIEKRVGPSKRTILLDLKHGRVRSRVQGRYDDGESKFEVKTRSAVAGVRGTDFIVAFDPGEQAWKMDVQTLSGKVAMDDTLKKRHADVVASTHASFIVSNPPSANASREEIDAAVARGQMSGVQKMSEEEVRDLNATTDILYKTVAFASLPRQPAASEKSNLCRAPAGAFNQCAWTCEGNPKGAKKCRADLPKVSCVRRLCRASGEWAEATVLPSKEGGVACESSSTIVGDCGGYW